MTKAQSLPSVLMDCILILIGVMCAGFGLKSFLLPGHFIDGGVTGISMLLSEISNIPLFLLIPVINLPFVIAGFIKIGKKFGLKSAIAILGLSLCLLLIDFPQITNDRLLTAVFGGFFLGAGIGASLRGGAVLDGTEIAAVLISRVKSWLKVGDIILLFNIVIFLSAAFFLGIEPALYSILTYMAASKTINFLIYGIEEYNAITIISDEFDTIRKEIIETLNLSVTRFKGSGGINETTKDILYCVVTKIEIGRIKKMVKEIDPYAFLIVQSCSDAEGRFIKKAAFH